jgi:hypothetical protein
MTTTSISVAKAKSHISELIAKSQYSHVEILEQYEEKQGLAAIAGKWQGFDEVAKAMGDIETLRANGGKGRDVSLFERVPLLQYANWL